MQSDDSTPQKNPGSSHTSIKAFGIEFSGPSWVALVLVVLAIIGGIIYFTKFDSDSAETAETNTPSFSTDNGTAGNSTDQGTENSDGAQKSEAEGAAVDPPAPAENSGRGN